MFQWAKAFGGTNYDSGAAVAVDSGNNVLTTGYFNGIVSFGCASPLGGTDALPGLFLVKFDSSGNCIWNTKAISSSNMNGTGIAVDSSNNVYVTGTFYGTTDGGSGALVSAGQSDVYIGKYDINGNRIWSQRFGGTNVDTSTAIGVDSTGNVYVTGYFSGTTDASSGSLASFGGTDVFLAKYNSAGSLVYAKHMGGTGADNGLALTVDSGGNVIIGGAYSGTATFGTATLTSTTTGMYLVKLNSSGANVWSLGIDNGSTHGASAHGLDHDSSGNVYVAGTVAGALSLAGSCNLPDASSGSNDIFAAKLNSSGTCLWAQRTNIVWNDSGNGVASDTSGDLFETGNFYMGADFTTPALSSNLVDEAFLVKFSP